MAMTFGDFVKWYRARLGMNAADFAKKIRVDAKSVTNIQRRESPDGTDEVTLSRIAGVFGLTELQLLDWQNQPLPPILGFDQNADPYSEVKVPKIPTFEWHVAAGNWVEIDGEGEVCDPRQIDHGLFRIRIRGDSMTPDYPDGSLIEFRCLRVDRDGLEVGKDYYVQREDGTATFKRLESVDEDEMVFRALNRKKYPKLMPVARSLVVRMARVEYILLKPATESK